MKTRFAFFGSVFAVALAYGANPPLLSVGAIAPEFSARTANNQLVKLSDFADRVVLVHFWSTWCTPSQESIKHFTQPLHEQYGARGLVVLGVVTSDTQERFDQAMIRGKNRWSYTMVFDTANTVGNLYKVSVTPTFYLIRNGRILYAGEGYAQQVLSAISDIVAKSPLRVPPPPPRVPAQGQSGGQSRPVRQ